MIKESGYLRTTEKIAAHIQKFVTRVGPDRKEEVFEMFDTMHLLFPQWVIMSCPRLNPGIHFISKNASHVFGHDQNYFSVNANLKELFSHIHDADMKEVYDCLYYVHNFLETVTPEEHTHYRFVFHYRFRKPSGQYIYLHDEKATVNLRGAGNLYYGLYRDVTTERVFTGVKVEMFDQQHTLTKIREYRPGTKTNPLSKREGELVTLMKQGLSTKEIAWHLNISHNTVRNIKSKLFVKYNVNNSIELLNMTG
jgi:DNA-binding CsgD family transcriptional regulator